MLKALLIIPALLLGSTPALAGHRPHYYGPYFACNHFGCFWSTPVMRRQPKIRLNEHCVYKPWKDKVVCKY